MILSWRSHCDEIWDHGHGWVCLDLLIWNPYKALAPTLCCWIVHMGGIKTAPYIVEKT